MKTPSCSQNIITDYQLRDPGPRHHIPKVSYDPMSHINIITNDSTQKTSIQKDSRIEMEKFKQELYLAPISEEKIEVISRDKEPGMPIHFENDKHTTWQVYDEIWDCLFGISWENFHKQTQRAYKIYKLFDNTRIEKIQRVKSYSTNRILKFTNPQIQHSIDYFANKKVTMKCQPRDPGTSIESQITNPSDSKNLSGAKESTLSISQTEKKAF
ncbi:6780_t:CDS:2 [Acaulospora morrowiae]|uniref:6780_t:CDS:1 n=1 Tax=Acaulospora morrowiae TaxID=94023 RepID=A0A9N9ALG6_9GLOM|nr:6780_t:CDS:2 [Acaulospora morrowiae]